MYRRHSTVLEWVHLTFNRRSTAATAPVYHCTIVPVVWVVYVVCRTIPWVSYDRSVVGTLIGGKFAKNHVSLLWNSQLGSVLAQTQVSLLYSEILNSGWNRPKIMWPYSEILNSGWDRPKVMWPYSEILNSGWATPKIMCPYSETFYSGKKMTFSNSSTTSTSTLE